VELRGHFEIEVIADVLSTERLRWFGHVKRMGIDSWVKRCYKCDWRLGHLGVDNRKHGEKFCLMILRVKRLNREDANDCVAWMTAIK